MTRLIVSLSAGKSSGFRSTAATPAMPAESSDKFQSIYARHHQIGDDDVRMTSGTETVPIAPSLRGDVMGKKEAMRLHEHSLLKHPVLQQVARSRAKRNT